MLIFIKSYLKSFSAVVWLLTVATLIEATGRFLVIPYLTLYLKQIGTSPAKIGFILAMAPLATILFSVIGGHLSDTIGRKPIQIIGVSVSGLALIGFAVLPGSPVVFGLLSFFSGMTATFFRPATAAAVADSTLPEQRAEAYGLLRVAANIGFALGPAFGILLFSARSNLGFWVAGTLDLLVGAYIAWAVPETSGRKVCIQASAGSQAEAKAAIGQGIWEWIPIILKDRVFWTWLFSMAVLMGVYDLIQSFLPLHLAQHGVPLWVYGVLLTLNGVMCVVLQMPLNRYFRSARIGPIYLLSKIPYLIGFLGFGFLTSPALLILSMFVLTLGEIAGAGVTVRFIPEHAPRELLGRYLGVSCIQEVGKMGMAIAAGFIFQSFGGKTLFVMAAGLVMIGGMIGRAADNRRLRQIKTK